MKNPYIPFPSEILEVIKHTEKEYTFRMEFTGKCRPGQFFEVSMPKYGEAPISISGIGENYIDLTIRRVGRVTDEVCKFTSWFISEKAAVNALSIAFRAIHFLRRKTGYYIFFS